MVVRMHHGMGRSCHVDGQLESDSVYQPFRSTVFSGCSLLSRLGLAARPQSSGRHIRGGVYRLCMVRTPHGIRESHLGQRMAFTRETNLALRSRPRGKELITHFIGDKQEIAIVEHTTDIRHYVAEEDTTVYVYGAKNSPDLQTEPGYKMEKEFNDWMSVYTFNFQ